MIIQFLKEYFEFDQFIALVSVSRSMCRSWSGFRRLNMGLEITRYRSRFKTETSLVVSRTPNLYVSKSLCLIAGLSKFVVRSDVVMMTLI